MSERTARRLEATSGLAFVALIGVALLLPGQPPKAQDSIETITALLVERRSAFLVGGYVAGLAVVAYLWFLGGVRNHLRAHGADRIGATASAGGIFAITVMLLGVALFSGVAFVAARLGDPPLVRALTDTGNTAIEMSKFGFAVLVLAVSSAGTVGGGLPRWLVRLGVISVPLMLVSAVALFVDHGAFQFGGVIDLGGAVPALVWIVGLSVVMLRSAS